MLRWKKNIRIMTYVTSDVFAIIGAMLVFRILYIQILKVVWPLNALETIAVMSMAIVFYVSFFKGMGIYESTIEVRGHLTLRIAFRMAIGYIMCTLTISGLLMYMNPEVNRYFMVNYSVFILIVQGLVRVVLHYTEFTREEKNQKVNNILIVGNSSRGEQYIEQIKKHSYLNMNIVGYVCIKDRKDYDGLTHLGELDQLEEIAVNHVVDEIAVVKPLSYDNRLKDKLNGCQSMGVTITMVLELQNTDKSNVSVAMVGNIPVLNFHLVSLNESQLFMKRMLDVVGSLFGMLVFIIAYIILAPMIKLGSKGPVIFKQQRVGKNGRVFDVWKFRSMDNGAEAAKESLMESNEMSGHMFKMKDDPRVTKLGAFLRKSSIDEIPQFYNVFRGDMSLVGTRPPTVKEVSEYEKHHRRRISITPGITGMWQISGRSDIWEFEEVVKIDSEYIRDWSIWLDIKILLLTIKVVFRRKGSF